MQTRQRLRDTVMSLLDTPVSRAIRELDAIADKAGVILYPQPDLSTFVAVMHANKDRQGYFNPIFDPPSAEAFWIAGVDANQGLVTTQAARLYHWQGTNLLIEAEALRLHYPNGRGCRAPDGENVEIGCPTAESITGEVVFTGGIWIRPDFRGPRPELGGMKLTRILARISRYVGWSVWRPDFSISSVSNALYEKGVAEDYGHPNAERGIKVAMQFVGEGGAVLLWSSRKDIEDDAERVLKGELSST